MKISPWPSPFVSKAAKISGSLSSVMDAMPSSSAVRDRTHMPFWLSAETGLMTTEARSLT